MANVALAVIGLLFLLVSVGAWIFFEEVLVVWLTVLFSMVKGVTLKGMLAWLAFLLKRWFLFEVPKYLLLILLTIGAPIRWRAAIRLFAKKLKVRVTEVRKTVQRHVETRLGQRAAITIALLASIAVFLVGTLYFGIYVLYFVGGGRLVNALIRFIGTRVQHVVFKTVMFFQLDKLWRFAFGLIPDTWKERVETTAAESRRTVIRRRRAVEGKLKGAFMTRRRVRLSGISAGVASSPGTDAADVSILTASATSTGHDTGQGGAERPAVTSGTGDAPDGR